MLDRTDARSEGMRLRNNSSTACSDPCWALRTSCIKEFEVMESIRRGMKISGLSSSSLGTAPAASLPSELDHTFGDL
jgi:hypothetical protein